MICYRCGTTFSLDHVQRNPVKRCSCGALLDKQAVDVYHPVPSPGDPNRDAKLRERDDVLAHVEAMHNAAIARKRS